jgi:hypothetical protein
MKMWMRTLLNLDTASLTIMISIWRCVLWYSVGVALNNGGLPAIAVVSAISLPVYIYSQIGLCLKLFDLCWPVYVETPLARASYFYLDRERFSSLSGVDLAAREGKRRQHHLLPQAGKRQSPTIGVSMLPRLFCLQEVTAATNKVSAILVEQRELRNHWAQEKNELEGRMFQLTALQTQVEGTMKKKEKEFEKLQTLLQKQVKDSMRGQKVGVVISKPIQKNSSQTKQVSAGAAVLKDAELKALTGTITELTVRTLHLF